MNDWLHDSVTEFRRAVKARLERIKNEVDGPDYPIDRRAHDHVAGLCRELDAVFDNLQTYLIKVEMSERQPFPEPPK